MADNLNARLIAGILWAGIGIAHAEPCFMRDENGLSETKCADNLPFVFPTGAPGELKVEAQGAVGQGFGAQTEQGAAPAVSSDAWGGQPGKFGVHGPEQVRQGKELQVVAPARAALK